MKKKIIMCVLLNCILLSCSACAKNDKVREDKINVEDIQVEVSTKELKSENESESERETLEQTTEENETEGSQEVAIEGESENIRKSSALDKDINEAQAKAMKRLHSVPGQNMIIRVEADEFSTVQFLEYVNDTQTGKTVLNSYNYYIMESEYKRFLDIISQDSETVLIEKDDALLYIKTRVNEDAGYGVEGWYDFKEKQVIDENGDVTGVYVK